VKFAVLAVLTLGAGAASASELCQRTAGEDLEGYRIVRIYTKTPFDFLPAARKSIRSLGSGSVTQGGSFSTRAWSAGGAWIDAQVRNSGDTSGQRILATAVLPQVCSIDRDTHTLEIAYLVFTNEFGWYASRTFETRQQEIEKPAATAAVGSAEGRFRFEPLLRYSHYERLVAGGRGVMRFHGGIFDTAGFHMAGSSSFRDAGLELSGSRTRQGKLWERADWRMAYSYLDLPTATTRLKEGSLAFRLSAATRPVAVGTLLRFGISAEGGNAQSRPPTRLPSVEPASSRDDSLKLYAGLTRRGDRYSLAASYGAQLGSISGASVDYVKHIADAAFTARLLPPTHTHKPVTMDGRFTVGSIRTFGHLPFAERFFGGNTDQYFLRGDMWQIRSAPFLRSIPAYRFGNGGVGGDRFYAVNTTVAVVTKSAAVLPKELTEDPEFELKLKGGLDSVKRTLAKIYAADQPAKKALAEQLGPLVDAVTAVKSDVAEAHSQTAIPASATKPIADAGLQLAIAFNALHSIQIKKNVEALSGSVSGVKAPIVLALADLGIIAASLQDGALRSRIFADTSTLRETAAAVVKSLDQIDDAPSREQAKSDVDAARSVVRTIEREMNLWAVSPVAVFDAARMWPDPVRKTRFGPGAGVRLSIVTFNVTVGYAANLNRAPGEGHGALFFSMDLTELFR
jgi:hypothetical protein